MLTFFKINKKRGCLKSETASLEGMLKVMK